MTKRIVLRVTATLFALTVLSLSTRADVQPNGSGWLCGSPTDWETKAVRVSPSLIASNFVLGEKTSVWTGMDLLRVQFVTVNKATDPAPFNAHFVGFDEAGEVTLATTLAPVLDRVDSGLETQEAEIYVRGRPLAKTTRLCASFVSK